MRPSCQVVLDSWYYGVLSSPLPICTVNTPNRGTTRSRYNSVQQALSSIHQALGTGVAQAHESHSTTFRNTRTAPIRDGCDSARNIRHSLQQSCSKCYPSRTDADRANLSPVG